MTADTIFKTDATLYAHWTKKSGGGSHSGGGSSGGGGSSTPTPVKPSTPEAGQPETPSVSEQFTDVPPGAWYREAVDFVVKTSLMTGYGNGTFGPDDNLSRAQLAQILFNKEGRPAGNGAGAFTDVAGGAWYAGAVAWAAEKEILNGLGDGRLDPRGLATRAQAAQMLKRYFEDQ